LPHAVAPTRFLDAIMTLDTLDPRSLLLILLGATILLLALSLLLRRGSGPAETFNTPARFFLVALRLAIGWHCLFEGLDKFHNPAWSSEAYLRESYGPLAEYYRGVAGDRVADRLTPAAEGELPAALDADWQAYFDAFAAHYGLTDEQRAQAQAKLDQAKKDTATWLASGKEEVTKIAPYPPELKVAMTIPERLKEYQRLRERAAAAEAELPSGDADLQKRWKDAKADVAKWRAGLKKSLDAQTAKMKEKLADVLTSNQKLLDPVPEPVVPPMSQWGELEWADFLVKWTLVVLGSLLLLGLFSRLASLGLAVLLLSFYLAMPPLPGWPDVPRLEGHYFYINKTFIEVLALLALTFIPTGRWLGLDALIALIFGRRATTVVREPVKVPADGRKPQPVA
jgi:uncharacterized membrane protein YphA (DoxX/SURF4 family)